MKKILSGLIILLIAYSGIYGMPPKPGAGIPHPVFPKGVEEPNKLKVKPGETRAIWNCLVIIIDFSNTVPTQTAASFDNMMFGVWVPGSVNDYYNEVSYGQFSLTGIVVGWYEASNTKNYFSNNNGFGPYPSNAPGLVVEAVDAAEAAGVDFSLYDNDSDGEVESIFIVHQGPGAEETESIWDIWSHKWSISGGGGPPRFYDGVWINTYTMMPEIHSDGSHIDIGVFCHEYAHALGLPDLYDYNNGSWTTINDNDDNPIRDWCLMSMGSWGNGDGSIPSHFCAWSKWQLGWITPTQAFINASATTTIYDIEEYENAAANPSFLIVYPNDNASSQEYFLLEYRRTEDRPTNNLFDHYDSDPWAGPSLQLDQGLIVMHVDATQPDGGGRWNDGSPNNSNYGIWAEAPGYNPAYAGAGFPEWTINGAGTAYEIKTGAAFGDVVDQRDFGFSLPIGSPGWYWANSRLYDGSDSNIELANIGIANPPGGPTMSIEGIEVAGVSIELSSFTATPSFNKVILNWRTESEYNTFEWLIERSEDNEDNYEVIGMVESKGNSPRPVTYKYEDRNTKKGNIYFYRLIRLAGSGNKTTYGPVAVKTNIPVEKITRIYPCPFKSSVNFEYCIPQKEWISFEIYAPDGRLVKILEQKEKEAGNHTITWDGKDYKNKELTQGIYFCRLSTMNSTFTDKIIKIK